MLPTQDLQAVNNPYFSYPYHRMGFELLHEKVKQFCDGLRVPLGIFKRPESVTSYAHVIVFAAPVNLE